MPDIAPFHPQIVHFVVALAFFGVGMRIVSWFVWSSWLRPSGTALLVGAALASVAAVQSGHEAHGPIERAPGAREIVQEHEELGERTRNLLLAIAVLELGALGLAKRVQLQRGLYVIAGLTGVYMCWVLFDAAEHGGELVYNYAGGPGLRSGDTVDVRRLLVAGLYHQAQEDRAAGRADDAARLTQELLRRMPGDPNVQFLSIESRIKDRHDPEGALTELAAMSIPADNPRLVIRQALLTAEALKDAGKADSAHAVLEALQQKFPDNPGVKRAVEQNH